MKMSETTSYRFGTDKYDVRLHGEWIGYVDFDTLETDMFSAKKALKHSFLNGGAPDGHKIPDCAMHLDCFLDGEEIELELLSKETQEKILDELLFKNRTHGTIVEYAEIVQDDEYDGFCDY